MVIWLSRARWPWVSSSVCPSLLARLPEVIISLRTVLYTFGQLVMADESEYVSYNNNNNIMYFYLILNVIRRDAWV